MIVFQGQGVLQQVENAVLTIGTFDGVHIGHKKIIQTLIESAKKINGKSVLITFHPHPRTVINPDKEIKLLSTNEEKIQLLNEFGLDVLYIIPFTRDFSNLSALQFTKEYLVNQIRAKKIIIGYDHHFGKDREGAYPQLKKFANQFGFEVEEIPARDIDDVVISSTQIRNALLSGDIKTASVYLGYNYMLTGIVIKGNQIGRTINFPTANIFCEDANKLIPANGIYAVRVKLDNRQLFGAMSIGTRPTVEQNGNRSIEVYIFDFNEDIYGKKLQVNFVEKIRDEQKFDSFEELQKNIANDVRLIKEIFKNEL